MPKNSLEPMQTSPRGLGLPRACKLLLESPGTFNFVNLPKLQKIDGSYIESNVTTLNFSLAIASRTGIVEKEFGPPIENVRLKIKRI